MYNASVIRTMLMVFIPSQWCWNLCLTFCFAITKVYYILTYEIRYQAIMFQVDTNFVLKIKWVVSNIELFAFDPKCRHYTIKRVHSIFPIKWNMTICIISFSYLAINVIKSQPFILDNLHCKTFSKVINSNSEKPLQNKITYHFFYQVWRSFCN